MNRLLTWAGAACVALAMLLAGGCGAGAGVSDSASKHREASTARLRYPGTAYVHDTKKSLATPQQQRR